MPATSLARHEPRPPSRTGLRPRTERAQPLPPSPSPPSPFLTPLLASPWLTCAQVQQAIAAGRRFIKSIQRPDGSWYGSWGCCFTYGTWFGVEGLVLSGEPRDSRALSQACAFLASKQNANGGWGEDFTSCYDKAYAEHGMERWGVGGSGVVNTAWALLALMAARTDNHGAVERGIAFLREQQLPNGDWAQEGIAGVFNRACGISYTQYRNIFPIWALARYHTMYEAVGAAGQAASTPRRRRRFSKGSAAKA